MYRLTPLYSRPLPGDVGHTPELPRSSCAVNAAVADWGGTTGAFADPDGYVWEVAHNPGGTFQPDGSIHI